MKVSSPGACLFQTVQVISWLSLLSYPHRAHQQQGKVPEAGLHGSLREAAQLPSIWVLSSKTVSLGLSSPINKMEGGLNKLKVTSSSEVLRFCFSKSCQEAGRGGGGRGTTNPQPPQPCACVTERTCWLSRTNSEGSEAEQATEAGCGR